MEDDDVELTDDSSFEVLSSGDENENYISMDFSSFYETASDFFASITDVADNKNYENATTEISSEEWPSKNTHKNEPSDSILKEKLTDDSHEDDTNLEEVSSIDCQKNESSDNCFGEKLGSNCHKNEVSGRNFKGKLCDSNLEGKSNDDDQKITHSHINLEDKISNDKNYKIEPNGNSLVVKLQENNHKIEPNDNTLVVKLQEDNHKIEPNDSSLVVKLQEHNHKIEPNDSSLVVKLQENNHKIEPNNSSLVIKLHDDNHKIESNNSSLVITLHDNNHKIESNDSSLVVKLQENNHRIEPNDSSLVAKLQENNHKIESNDSNLVATLQDNDHKIEPSESNSEDKMSSDDNRNDEPSGNNLVAQLIYNNFEKDFSNLNRSFSVSLDPLTPYFNWQVECIKYPDLNPDQYMSIDNMYPIQTFTPNISGDIDYSMEGYTTNPCIISSTAMTVPTSEAGDPTRTETLGLLECYKSQIEEIHPEENRIACGDTAIDIQRDLIDEFFQSYKDQKIHGISQECNENYGANQSYAGKKSETDGEQPGLRSKGCQENSHKCFNQSSKLYSWFRCNKYLQNFLKGAKASFSRFVTVLENEINLIFGTGNPLKVVIFAEDSDSMAIEAAFCQTFDGQVAVSRYTRKIDSMNPALPIGYCAALQAAQTKIHMAKKFCAFEMGVVLVSTAKFIAENVPQRWQMSTVLCLEDPIRDLNLHNFTLTIPVPNEYVDQARKLTPDDYPYKDYGLGVTLKDAIDYMVKTESEDEQGFLSGVNNYVTVKSAASVLAGMYGKYARRCKGVPV